MLNLKNMPHLKIYFWVILLIVVIAAFIALAVWLDPNLWGTIKNISSGTQTSGEIKPPACTHNWVCDWGPCANGKQSQTAVDSNNCKTPITGTIACPATTRDCK